MFGNNFNSLLYIRHQNFGIKKIFDAVCMQARGLHVVILLVLVKDQSTVFCAIAAWQLHHFEQPHALLQKIHVNSQTTQETESLKSLNLTIKYTSKRLDNNLNHKLLLLPFAIDLDHD
jgi:hypothetical protein